MEGPEWDAQAHGTMHSGRGEEETTISRGGREVDHSQVFQRLWSPPRDGDLLQIPRAGDLGNGRRLSRVGEELGLVEEVVEDDVVHPKHGGINASGVRLLF